MVQLHETLGYRMMPQGSRTINSSLKHSLHHHGNKNGMNNYVSEKY